MAQEAEYDYLTELPVLTSLFEGAVEALEGESHASVIFVKMGGAGAIERRFGPHFYEGLVSQTSGFLKTFSKSQGEQTQLCHWGADDFVLIVPGAAGGADIVGRLDESVFGQLKNTLAEEIFEELELGLGHSTIDPQEGPAPLERRLLRALQEAEAAARQDRDRSGRRAREALLRSCLDDNKLHLVHQPIFSTGKVEGEEADMALGYEVLVRAEVDGLRDPKKLYRTAEECDLVWEISRRVREMAAEPLERMRSDELLFLNMHPADFSDPSFLRKEIWEPPLSVYARRMVFDITFREGIHDFDLFRDHLAPLAKAGFRTALDVGASYADVASLMFLRPDFVKIDRTFIAGIESDEERQRAVSVLTDVGRAASFKVIAVGVETEDEAEALKRFGCHYLQGFFMGRPQRELVHAPASQATSAAT